MINPELVRVTGSLSPFREGFGTWLETAGYSRKMRAVHLRLMGDLSCWLGQREETIAGLAVRPGSIIVDGTFGRGGHTRALLEVPGYGAHRAALRSLPGHRPHRPHQSRR